MNRLQAAQQFVESLSLPPRSGYESADPIIDFNAVENQAMVVGSDVVSFVKGITAERRQDIVNATLLAQLAANKQVSDRSRILDWYNAYFDVLTNVGWVLQDNSFSSYEERADGLQAHEAILQVAGTLLAGSPTALALVTSTLEAMKSMDKDNPWITIFDRESKFANTARFQVALADQDEAGQFMVSLMAFALEAQSTLTQVLFFKIHKNDVSLKRLSSQITINEDVLDAVRDTVRNKLKGRISGFVDALNLD